MVTLLMAFALISEHFLIFYTSRLIHIVDKTKGKIYYIYIFTPIHTRDSLMFSPQATLSVILLSALVYNSTAAMETTEFHTTSWRRRSSGTLHYSYPNPNNSKNRLPDCNGVFTGPCYYAGAVSKGGQTSLDRYEGEILNSRWHGAGIYYYLDPGDLRGDRYEGNFINGSKEGKGTYYWSSRDVYVGDFKNNKIEGFGTKTYSTGSKYVGEFKNGQFDGQGTFTYLTEGDEYVGQFKEDYRHGSGIYSYANGERYVGMYQKGKKNGQGILYGKNGSILKQGVWKDGKFVEAPVPPPLVTIPPPIKPKPTITPPPPVKPKPSITPPPAPVETSFDGKRQKCLRLGLKPGTEDYRSCMD